AWLSFPRSPVNPLSRARKEPNMSDIRELLDRTAYSVEVTPLAETVEADLRRGRAALARRRRGRALRFSVRAPVGAVALAGTTIVAGNLGGTGETTGPAAPGIGAHQSSGPDRGAPVRLVAYHRGEVDRLIVHPVPEGGDLQGSNTFRLTIAPQGDTASPDDFVGKLVVMLLSSSAPQ